MNSENCLLSRLRDSRQTSDDSLSRPTVTLQHFKPRLSCVKFEPLTSRQKRTGYYKLHVIFEKGDRFKGSRLVHGTVRPNRENTGH